MKKFITLFTLLITLASYSQLINYTSVRLDEGQNDAYVELETFWSKINEKALSIITQACEQNGSNIVPDFQIYEDLSSAIDHESFSIFFDLDATNDFQSIKNIEDSITLITGPESGFSKKEREFLNATTSHNISLGKNILRAETAPITALSVIKSNLGLL